MVQRLVTVARLRRTLFLFVFVVWCHWVHYLLLEVKRSRQWGVKLANYHYIIDANRSGCSEPTGTSAATGWRLSFLGLLAVFSLSARCIATHNVQIIVEN